MLSNTVNTEHQFTLVKTVWLTANCNTLPLATFMSKFMSFIASLEGEQTSELEVCFLLNTYCLPTISKSKNNYKWNLDKSETFVLKPQVPS